MGRRAAPVGDPWKANGHAAEGSQSDRWIPVQLGVCAPRCRLTPGLRVLISVGHAGEEPTGWSNARSCPARMDTLPSWFVASPPHLARGVRLEPRVRIPRRQQQGGVHQRRGHSAGELARVAHLVDGVPDHRSGQRIQDLDDPYHQLPRHTPSARNHSRPAGLWTLPHRPRLASPPGVALLAHGSPESGKGARSWAIGHLLSTGHSRRRLSRADISSGWRWRSAHRGERRGCGCWHRALHRQLRALGQRVEAGSRRGRGLAPARTDRDPEAPATDLRGVFIGGVSAACVSRTGGSARRAGGGRCQIWGCRVGHACARAQGTGRPILTRMA